MALVRTIAIIGMAVLVTLKDRWPPKNIDGVEQLILIPGVSEQTAWVIVAALAAATLTVWGWARGARSSSARRWIGIVEFMLDAAVAFGFVAIFSPHGGPFVAVLSYVTVSGSIRYAWIGAGVALAAIANVLPLLMATLGLGVDWDYLTFALVTSAAIGFVVASASSSWHKRRVEFERQAARLVELDRLKDRYIAITSHEIRGPVSTMITAVDTVRSRWDKLNPERRDHLLEMVWLQGRELDRLVQDLFISAEVQGGGLNLQPEWVELESTIKRAVESASGKRRGHLLELFVDPLRVELDPYRVTQIVRNLVENAYKYTDNRTRVVVSAKGVSGGVQLEVRDDGEGIPLDKRDKLFEAFSRIEETAAGQEGVGLGLYVVSQLVAAMNGRIDLQSSSRGTTFSIFLPCSTAPLGRPQIGLVDDEASHG